MFSNLNRIGSGAPGKSFSSSILKLIVVYYFTVFSFNNLLYGQSSTAENAFEADEEISDGKDVYESLQDMSEYPENLKKINKQELYKLPWMTPQLADLLYNQTDSVSVKTVKSAIPDYLRPLYNMSMQYFTINNLGKKPNVKYRQRMVFMPDNSRGYVEGKYPGNSIKIYQKLGVSLNKNLDGGLVMEKDPGEKAVNDFSAGFGRLKTNNIQIIAGNFVVKEGQGLVFWGPYKLTKSYNTLSAFSGTGGIKPYTSTDENMFFNGLAIDAKVKFMRFSGFYSRKKMDARIVNGYITGFPVDGMHRTDSEKLVRDAAAVTALGFNTSAGSMDKTIGLHVLSYKFNKPLSADFSRVSDNGPRNIAASLDFQYRIHSCMLWGETARTYTSHFNFISGILYGKDNFNFIVMLRRYKPDYENFYASVFGESGNPVNEEGIYWGWDCYLNKSSRIMLNVDHYKHLQYNSSMRSPIQGWDIRSGIEKTINTETSVFVYFKYQKGFLFAQTTDANGNEFDKLFERHKSFIRFQLEFKPKKYIRAKTRIEYGRLNWNSFNWKNTTRDSSSILVYNDIRLEKNKKYFQIRLTLFDAPLYDLRFYEFENDLPGLFRSKMFYGRGSRLYFIAGIRFSGKCALAMKYETIRYDNITTIGSGYDEISGNQSGFVSVQLDWAF